MLLGNNIGLKFLLSDSTLYYSAETESHRAIDFPKFNPVLKFANFPLIYMLYIISSSSESEDDSMFSGQFKILP